MSIDIRLPNITATNDSGKLAQVQSYMYQLVEQLNWALNNINFVSPAVENSQGKQIAIGTKDTDPIATFNDIKGLIIKSADIVNAYYEEINRKLSGIYVAESEFGIYAEQTTKATTDNSKYITDLYSNIQQIVTEIEGVQNSLREVDVNAHIKSGLLDYADDGSPVYGLEIGQRTAIDGVETFNTYARFTANKLTFYDKNDNEVAYISDYKLYITNVEITGSLTQGNFVDTVRADGSVVTKWIGGA